MKGLRAWILFIPIFGLALALAACDLSMGSAERKAREEAAAKVAAEQQQKKAEAGRVEGEKRVEEARQRGAERRQELVKSIRAAFDPTRTETSSDQPTWVSELRRGSPQPASEACEKRDKFYSMNWALGPMDSEAEDRISWSEIGLEEGQARKFHRETGLAVAKSFLAIFSLPREIRQNTTCGRGEGTFDLHDGLRIMQEISRILQSVKAEPKAIGSSPAMLRQILLKDLREQITYLRGEIKAARTSASDGAGRIRWIAEEATREWSFTPKELGLTTEEVAMLQKKE